MDKLQGAIIEWVDSCAESGWRPLSDDVGTANIKSCGILLRCNRTEVVISTSKSQYGRVMDQLAIPRKAITKIKRFKL